MAGFEVIIEVIQSFGGMNLCECSLFLMGMYLLGVVVRYRPNIWANAVARRALSSQLPDDSSIALIEEFVSLGLNEFPSIVTSSFTEPF